MTRRRRYAVVFAPAVLRHIDAIDRKYHGLIRAAITEQLSRTLDTPTRNRKPLEDLPGPLHSTWELRCGPDNRFRVFYDVEGDAVWVLAIAVKQRNRLFIGGREFEP
jgi:mRNA-degrading endonuclease RelE of RelBE toxin-antitoxin system